MSNDPEEVTLNFDGWLDQQPDETKEPLAQHLAFFPALAQTAEKQRLASIYAVATAENVDPVLIGEQWELARAGFAENRGGIWSLAKNDDAAFYSLLKTEALQRRDERQLLQGWDHEPAPLTRWEKFSKKMAEKLIPNLVAGPLADVTQHEQKVEAAQKAWEDSLVNREQQAAFEGKDWTDALADWQTVARGKPGYDEARTGFYAEQARAIHGAMARTIARVGPRAEQIYNSIAKARGVIPGAGDSAPFELMRDLTPGEKQVAFTLMARRAGQGPDKSSWDGFAQALTEATTRGFENLAVGGNLTALGEYVSERKPFQAGDKVTERDARQEIGEDFRWQFSDELAAQPNGAAFGREVIRKMTGRVLTAEEAARWNEEVPGFAQDIKTAEELRKFGQETIDPTDKSGSWARRKLLLPVADSVTVLTSTEFGGWTGLALSARSYQGDEFRRLSAAGMADAEAYRLSRVVGLGQAALDRASLGALGNGVKFTRQALQRAAFSGSTVTRLGRNWAGTTAAETFIELAQDHLIPALVQDNLTNDPRFDVDWGDVWLEAAQAAPETALGMLLLSGLGSIAQTRGQNAHLRELSANRAALRLSGYLPEQIEQIQAAPLAQRGDLLAEHLPEKAPEGEERAALIAEFQTLAQLEQQTFAGKQRAEEVSAAEAAAHEISMTRSGSGWWVTQGDKSIQVDSTEAALRLREDLQQTATTRETERLMAEAEAWVGGADAETARSTTFLGHQATATATGLLHERDGVAWREELSPEQGLNRLHGEAARLAEMSGHGDIQAAVNGSNEVTFRENVADGALRIVQQLKIYRGVEPALRTLLHERVEVVHRTLQAKAARGEAGGLTLADTARALILLAPSFDPAQAQSEAERGLFAQVQKAARGEASSTEIEETLSELAVTELTRRQKDGSPAGATTLREALRTALEEARTPGEVQVLSGVKATLAALRTYTRAVLGIVAAYGKKRRADGVEMALDQARREGRAGEFDTLIDRLTGTESRRTGSEEQMAGQPATAAGELAPETGLAFAVQPRRFEDAVDDAVAGKLPPNAVLDLGTPGEVLIGAGLPDLPMQIRQRMVRKKTTKHHELTREVMRALPAALRSPMMVYVSPDDRKAHAIVTSIATPQGPVTGYFTVRMDQTGTLVLDAKSVFGKNPDEIISEARRARKAGGQVYLNESAFNDWLASQARGVLADTSHQHQLNVEGLQEIFNASDENASADGAESERAATSGPSLEGQRESLPNTPVLGHLASDGTIVLRPSGTEEQGTAENGGLAFSLKKGASLNSQKKEIPATEERMPKFFSRGTFEEVRERVVEWMKNFPIAQAPDGRAILIVNPELGSLERRAEHWMGSLERDDSYKKGEREFRIEKAQSIAAIPRTIEGAQVKASSPSGAIIYLRKYAGGVLHAVFTDEHGRLTQHGLVSGGVETQYTLDPVSGIKGADVLEDWTKVSPAPSVNPSETNAEVDRATTPGPRPESQQGGTPDSPAQSHPASGGEIVNRSPSPEERGTGGGEGRAFSLAPSSPERDARTVEPVKIEIEALPGRLRDWRQTVRDYIKAHLQGRTVTNTDTGRKIGFNAESKGEAVSKTRREPALRTALQLEDIVERALHLGDMPPDASRAGDTAQFEYFAVPVEIDGHTVVAWFNVRQHLALGGRTFYEFGLHEKAVQTAQGLDTDITQPDTPQPAPRLKVGEFLAQVKDTLPAAVKVDQVRDASSDGPEERGGLAFSIKLLPVKESLKDAPDERLGVIRAELPIFGPVPRIETPHEAFIWFEKHLVGKTIKTSAGVPITIKPGHFSALTAEKNPNDPRKGFVVGYSTPEEYRGALRRGEVLASQIPGYIEVRARQLQYVERALREGLPLRSIEEPWKIVFASNITSGGFVIIALDARDGTMGLLSAHDRPLNNTFLRKYEVVAPTPSNLREHINGFFHRKLDVLDKAVNTSRGRTPFGGDPNAVVLHRADDTIKAWKERRIGDALDRQLITQILRLRARKCEVVEPVRKTCPCYLNIELAGVESFVSRKVTNVAKLSSHRLRYRRSEVERKVGDQQGPFSGRVGVPPAEAGVSPDFLSCRVICALARHLGRMPKSAGGTPTLPESLTAPTLARSDSLVHKVGMSLARFDRRILEGGSDYRLGGFFEGCFTVCTDQTGAPLCWMPNLSLARTRTRLFRKRAASGKPAARCIGMKAPSTIGWHLRLVASWRTLLTSTSSTLKAGGKSSMVVTKMQAPMARNRNGRRLRSCHRKINGKACLTRQRWGLWPATARSFCRRQGLRSRGRQRMAGWRSA